CQKQLLWRGSHQGGLHGRWRRRYQPARCTRTSAYRDAGKQGRLGKPEIFGCRRKGVERAHANQPTLTTLSSQFANREAYEQHTSSYAERTGGKQSALIKTRETLLLVPTARSLLA